MKAHLFYDLTAILPQSKTNLTMFGSLLEWKKILLFRSNFLNIKKKMQTAFAPFWHFFLGLPPNSVEVEEL